MMNLVGDVFWMSVIGVLLVGFVYLTYAEGWFGLATRDRMRIIIDKLQRRVTKTNEQIDAWQKRMADKDAADQAKSIPPAPVLQRDKATRIAEAQSLLASGTITQADFDAAKIKILSE